jgi:alpha-glucosidase
MFQLCLAAILLTCCALPALAGDPGPGHAPWWKHAVFYEIYPRSFQDSDGSGVGDLAGVTARLGYLQELGIDAIWLTPFFPSPQVDFGYDISDYCAVDPRFGTLKDFDRLVAEARRRGIRVFLDLVLNHTSDQHPWFRESRASVLSHRRDWYVWRKGRPDGGPPSNWLSGFGGSAWTLDPATGEYYYHYFYPEQPDLNWHHPDVREAMFEVIRWWLRRGVAGFRLDAVDMLFEDPLLRDNPPLCGNPVPPGPDAQGGPKRLERFNYKMPEVHGLLRDLRRVADEQGAVLVGEIYTESAEDLKAYCGERGEELQLPTGHLLALAERASAPVFRRRIEMAEATGCWPVWVLDNHDLPRSVSRWGDGRHDEALAKATGAILLTLRGTPILYYGEELAMENNDPKRPEDVRDPQGLRGWPHAKLRDGARTPMQWDAGPGAGFTRGKPWLPIPPSAARRNVAAESQDPGSVLNFHRRLIALRRRTPALLDGSYQTLCPDDPDILAYLRRQWDQTVLVAVNLSPRPRPLELGLPGKVEVGEVLRSDGGAGLPKVLEPYGVVVATLVGR